jgi:putative DNA primase/helicase
MEMCLGDYCRKFGVEMLTAKQRIEAGKPMPEFRYWNGVRILYCTEPNHSDVLNTGIMKDLTGGEKIIYRMLFSNEMSDFRPQFKLSIMCNDTPKIDGSDSGVKRRIRKIDYMSQFVSEDQVDESKHFYRRDDGFIYRMREDPRFKMEFLRYLLDNYDHDYEFAMPDVVKSNSAMYLDENDGVYNFAEEYIVKDENSYFTLKQAKDAFKMSEHFNGKLLTLKNDLQKLLKCVCVEQKKINKRVERSVFSGYKIVYSTLDIQ